MDKTNRSYIRKIRYIVQWSVFSIVLYAGIGFCFFVKSIENNVSPMVARSPSIDWFMPIGALMAFKLWITDGIFDPIYPAAIVIFIGAISLSFLLKKSFCSWICPVGTISEIIWKIGEKAFGKNFSIKLSLLKFQ